MECPYCGKQARWCENKEKYGKNYGKSYMCYLCECGAYVGCHNNTKKPLGTLASPELQQLRRKVHTIIDPMWRNGKMTRRNVYAYLSKIMGKTYHTGETTIEDCKKLLNLLIK